VGIIVVAALILVDGLIGSIEVIDMEPLFSLPFFKFLVGIITLAIGGALIEQSRKKSSA
jgi:hypothetical protein